MWMTQGNNIITHFLMVVFVAMFRLRIRSLSLSRTVRTWLMDCKVFFISSRSNCPLLKLQLVLPMCWALEERMEDSKAHECKRA